MRFTSRTITDPDGNVHVNPRSVSRGSVNLKREHAKPMLIVAILLLAIAGFLTYRSFEFSRNAERAQGVVIRVDSKESTNNDHNQSSHKKRKTTTLYRPVVSFHSKDGGEFSLASAVWTSRSSTVGDKVQVLYDAKNPNSAVLDSFFDRYGLAMILGFFSVFLIILAIVAYYINPGQYHYLRVDGQVWKSTEGPIPMRESRSSLSFGKFK